MDTSAQALASRLQQRLQPSALEVVDESADHAGHVASGLCEFAYVVFESGYYRGEGGC